MHKIKESNFTKFLFKKRIIRDNPIENIKTQERPVNEKLNKFKSQEATDIWSISETFNDISTPTTTNRVEKPNLRQDIFNEMLGFKLKRLNKSGARTPRELWQRVKYLSKGLTLDEWSDRVETSWENMLEYTEKLWENFFIFSFKKYKWYPLTQKLWSDSWYGQNWRNWRREEDAVTWQTNSRIPWHKHIRLSNDAASLFPKEVLSHKEKEKLRNYTFPQNAEKTIGAARLKLNNQIFTNVSRHEIIKQGVYNLEQPEVSILNAWQDSANIYLKYIRPWLFRLNSLDKPYYNAFKYLGKEQHRKNYQVVPQRNIFQNEVYKISYNLKLIKTLKGVTDVERKFGKRNALLYQKNKDKFEKLLKYEKLLYFRQSNQNLSPQQAFNPMAIIPPRDINKNILTIFFLIHYIKPFKNKILQVNSNSYIAWIFKPALFFGYKTIRVAVYMNCFFNWKKGVFYYLFSKNKIKKDKQFRSMFHK